MNRRIAAEGSMVRAFFLDRDGVIIEEADYLSDPARVKLLPGAAEAIRKLHAAGFIAVVVTNQSGVARGYFQLSDVEAVHRRMNELLSEHGADAVPDSIYICPHHAKFGSPCTCRKPAPGLLLTAAREHAIDLGGSFMIGDRSGDLQAGVNAGCRESFLVETGYGENSRAEVEAAGFRVFPGILEAVTAGLAES